MNDQIDEIYQEIDKLERKQKDHNSRISVIRNNLSDIKMNISNAAIKGHDKTVSGLVSQFHRDNEELDRTYTQKEENNERIVKLRDKLNTFQIEKGDFYIGFDVITGAYDAVDIEDIELPDRENYRYYVEVNGERHDHLFDPIIEIVDPTSIRIYRMKKDV